MDILVLRKALHEYMDPLWQNAQISRKELYDELGKVLGKEAHVSEMTEQEIEKCAVYLRHKLSDSFPCDTCKWHTRDRFYLPVCAKKIERKVGRCARFKARQNISDISADSIRSSALGT